MEVEINAKKGIIVRYSLRNIHGKAPADQQGAEPLFHHFPTTPDRLLDFEFKPVA